MKFRSKSIQKNDLRKALFSGQGLSFFGGILNTRKMHRRFFFFSLLFASLLMSSCSVYRSAVRKDFENRAPGRLTASATSLGECVELSPLAAWIERELPGGAFELLVAENDMEVWKRTLSDGEVEIRSFRSLTHQTLACHQLFSSEQDWLEALPAYFDLLDSVLD